MALIKCPECRKEISDTIKSCPHCGFKMKTSKNNKILEKVKSNKKIQIILGIILLIIVLVFIIVMNLTKENRGMKKLAKHLESVGYSCNYDGYEYICKRSEGIKLEEITIKSLSYIHYSLESKDEYKISVNSRWYTSGDFVEYITVFDEYHGENCQFIPSDFGDSYHSFGQNGEHWKVGDIAKSGDNCSYDFTEKVNAMLREFESYFRATGLKLG